MEKITFEGWTCESDWHDDKFNLRFHIENQLFGIHQTTEDMLKHNEYFYSEPDKPFKDRPIKVRITIEEIEE